jgi:Tol biopolymer transport system component
MRQIPKGADTPEKGALFIARADGSHLRRITEFGVATSHDNAFAHWSPDGRWIVFGGLDGRLYLIRPDGSEMHRLHLAAGRKKTYALAPNWSPDSRQIIFPMYTAADDRVDLYTVRLDGSHLTRITNTPEDENFADWTS